MFRNGNVKRHGANNKWREENYNNILILIASTTMGKCNVKGPYVSTNIGRFLDFNKFRSSCKVRF
jgi:hypothetical protein